MKQKTQYQLMIEGYNKFHEMFIGSPAFDDMRHHFPDVAHNLAYYAYTHGYNSGWQSRTNRERRRKAELKKRGLV